MSQPAITVYGANWCPDCRRSKGFLGEHQIPYAWVDVELDPAAEQEVIKRNGGKRIIPTIVFADGSHVAEPSNAELAEKLGLKTTARLTHYPAILIGGGPAGLTAALYLAREGIETLVIERAALGGQAAATAQLDNMPGFPGGVAGGDFADRLRQQAEQFGVEMLQAQDVTRIWTEQGYHCVRTASGQEYNCCALVLVTGSRYRRLGVPGEESLMGAGIHFCATCDGPFYKGKQVVVVGGGNSALEESHLLARFADHVTILVRSGEFKASQVVQESIARVKNVSVRFHTEVEEFVGKGAKLAAVRLRNNQTGAQETMPVDGAFIFIGLDPNTGFLADSPVRRNEFGFIVTGHDLMHGGERPPGYEQREPGSLETSVPGIFAAGDVREGSTKQLASALGEGATVALLVREHLKTV